MNVKIFALLVFTSLLSWNIKAQTLKIAHKSHSGTEEAFTLSTHTYNFGLGEEDVRQRKSVQNRQDSIAKTKKKSKVDSLKKKSETKQQKKRNQKGYYH